MDSSTLPLTAHPLYTLRKVSIFIAVLGAFFCFFCSPIYYQTGEFLATAFFLAVSSLFCAADVVLYAIKKAQDPENDPPWPQKKWIVGDAIFAVILLWVFWMTVCTWVIHYNPSIFGAWGALGAFLCSLLHARAFWKQVLARKHNSWLANLHLPPQPCGRCGYTPPPSAPNNTHSPAATTAQSRHHNPQQQPPSAQPYISSSAPDLRSSNTRIYTPLSPTTEESSGLMEEGLLIGSDFGGYGYGSIADPDPEHVDERMVEQPEEVVVVGKAGKGKKKGKVWGSAVGG